MFGRCLFPAATAIAAAVAFAAPAAAPVKPSSGPSRQIDVVGMYDGGQTEMAAGLELREDGRFRYGLSYGALDEQAQGTWTADEGQVLLTSDPFVPPRFVLVNRLDAPAGQLRIMLNLPDAMSRQYFQAELRFADGRVVDQQLSDGRSRWTSTHGKSRYPSRWFCRSSGFAARVWICLGPEAA